MEASETPTVGPPVDAFDHAFYVQEVRTDGDQIYYYGTSMVPRERLLEEVWPTFQQAGFEVYHTKRTNEDVLVAKEADNSLDGVPWLNVLLFVLTICSTLFVGTFWFHIDVTANPLSIWKAWPFTVSIMTVLGVHELGHYAMSRYHGVDASLPYFIPVPSLIGTMGAVIKMKGHMPNRKALFDIGVAGPLAGLVATIAVTVIGLHLDPVAVPQEVIQSENAVEISLGFPYLLRLLAWLTGQPLNPGGPNEAIHPVVIGGWVGMFVTFLNMLPVGQLDGGHIVRAMAGEYQETIAGLVPGVLIALAAFLYYVQGVAGQAVFIWVFWGGLALVVAFVGPATPIDDENELGTPRKIIGVITFVLALLCFTWVPIEVIG